MGVPSVNVDATSISYVSRGGEQPLWGLTIDRFVRRVAARHAEREAIVSIPQSRRLSYCELDAAVEDLAKGLVALGAGRGTRVGVWSTDNIEWILLQIATARIGAILVNVNPAYRPTELEHALVRARVEILFLIPQFKSSRYVEMLAELCPELERPATGTVESAKLPDLQHVVIYDPDNVEATRRPAPGLLTWPEALAGGSSVSSDAIRELAQSLDPDDPINIQFTSGTTGSPKAVLLTHHNILNNAYFTAEVMRFTEEDRLCVPVPFYHCFGMVVANLACLTHGAAIVIPAPHFDAGATLEAIECERCTALHGVPTMFIAELEHDDFHRRDLSTLRTGVMAGAPCPPELVRRVIDDMGCTEILIGYGQTEASPITHLTRPGDSFERRVGTVGTSLDHQEAKIVDTSTGALVPVGVPGEVCFRGYHIMRGYYGQDEETCEAIDDAGWLHSGDLGVLDEDGYLRITGRLKDMIIRGGENIYPAEIEAFYFEHPKVSDVAVFGVPDEKLGEEVGVWIKLHEGRDATTEEFRDYARGRIAHFKVPRYVWIVDEFPVTVTGKIQKFRIRDTVQRWLSRRGEFPAAGDESAVSP